MASPGVEQSPVDDVSASLEPRLYDKRGIPFERGDIVKVFHFVGANRKRHYMYKQCLGSVVVGSKFPYFRFSHLNFIEDWLDSNGPYGQRADGRKLGDYEIVQSLKFDHERRDAVGPGPNPLPTPHGGSE